MSWDQDLFYNQLASAVDAADTDTIDRLIHSLESDLDKDSELTSETAADLMSTLRRRRYFAEMERVGEILIRIGKDDISVWRQLGQARIEQNKFSEAEDVLRRVVGDSEIGDPENNEARGLLGRLHKQQYVAQQHRTSSEAHKHLVQAVTWYYSVYQRDRRMVWHGINTSAVVLMAARHELDVSGLPDPLAIAAAVRGEVWRRFTAGRATTWDLATGLESALALGLPDEVDDWAKVYVKSDNADAFELASTLRQMQEIWELRIDDGDVGSWLLPLLHSSILRQDEGAVEIDYGPDDIDLDRFEAVLGTEFFESARWLRSALERSEAVVKVRHESGRFVGSGFVVDAGDFPSLTDGHHGLVVVTNAHVMSPTPLGSNIDPDEAKITFEGGTDEYHVDAVLWTSPPDEFDVTFATTDPPLADVTPLRMSKRVPNVSERVYIIGHPDGRELSFSMYDNQLLTADQRHLYYRTPTEPGNSGSPVFDKGWRLIGVHHVGATKVPPGEASAGLVANRGVKILAILAALSH